MRREAQRRRSLRSRFHSRFNRFASAYGPSMLERYRNHRSSPLQSFFTMQLALLFLGGKAFKPQRVYRFIMPGPVIPALVLLGLLSSHTAGSSPRIELLFTEPCPLGYPPVIPVYHNGIRLPLFQPVSPGGLPFNANFRNCTFLVLIIMPNHSFYYPIRLSALASCSGDKPVKEHFPPQHAAK